MKTINTIILMFFLLISSLNATDLINIKLTDFIKIVSKENNFTILINDDIDKKFTLLVNKDITKEDYQNIFIDILFQNDFILTKKNNYYYVEKIDNVKTSIRFIKLNYLTYEDIKDILGIYNVKHKFLNITKTLYINSSLEVYNNIKSQIIQNDIEPKQYKLKITILETNINKLRELGVEFIQNRTLTSDSNLFFNLVAYPFNATSSLALSKSKSLSIFLNYLNENEVSKFVSTPILSIFNNKEANFEVVKNIPYVTGSTVIDDDNSKTTNSYSYKDVGLKIKILPTIYKDSIYLDFDLVSENIVDSSDTPTTTKILINKYIRLKENELFFISGINQSQKINNIQGLPYLQDIPIIGWLFKKDSDTYNNINNTIILQLVKDDMELNYLNINEKVKSIHNQYFQHKNINSLIKD